MGYIISNNGINLIKQFEGFIPYVYQKPGDVPTIGYGTTFYPNGKFVKFGDPSITPEQATEYLLHFVNSLVSPVLNKYVKILLNQNNVDALSDFIYNVGTGKPGGTDGFIPSHLLQAINANAGKEAITVQFKRWIYVNHKPNDWQIKRRNAEIQLYFS